MNATYCRWITPFLFSALLCGAEASAAPFTVEADLFNQTQTDTLGLSVPAGTETHTIFAPKATGDQFSNGVVMIGFKGALYCMWQSSATDEDAEDTWVAYSRSLDGGMTWTEPMVLEATIAGGYCSSGGWHVAGDTLVAYINQWPGLTPRGGFAYYKTSTDGLDWTEKAPVKMLDGSDLNGIFEQDPHALPDGRMVNAVHFQPGLILSPVYTDDPGGTNGWVRADFLNLSVSDNVSREIEPSWFLRRDGSLVMTFRDQTSTYYKLASISTDRGETWSTPVQTLMRDARTKQSCGNLPNGAAFMAGNPNDDKLRSPLAIAVSDNGDHFDKAFLLRSNSDMQPLRFAGKAKRAGYHYPKSMVWNGYLYVAYSTNKEDVDYTRIPLSAIYPEPSVQLIQVSNESATIAYTTPDFGTYCIQSTSLLSNAVWSTVVSNQPSGCCTNAVTLNGAGQEYFRVMSE